MRKKLEPPIPGRTERIFPGCPDLRETRSTARRKRSGGREIVVLTNMDGEHWTELPRENMPAALPRKAVSPQAIRRFARRKGTVYFGTVRAGGAPFSRRMISPGHGRVGNPIVSGNASSGIFSSSARENHCRGRGDYQDPARAVQNGRFSRDGGETLELATQTGRRVSIGVGEIRRGYVT